MGGGEKKALTRPKPTRPTVYVSGRFFPYADRPSVLVDDAAKYWFRVTGVGPGDRLCIEISRVTGLEDQRMATDPATIDPAAIPALSRALEGAGDLQFAAVEALEMIKSPAARAVLRARDERIAQQCIAKLSDPKALAFGT